MNDGASDRFFDWTQARRKGLQIGEYQGSLSEFALVLDLASLLGHSQTRTTKRYTHVQVVGTEVPVDWERLTRGPAKVLDMTKAARECDAGGQGM
jgi:hypothetical protein